LAAIHLDVAANESGCYKWLLICNLFLSWIKKI
jgi:hypothetical protein